MVVIFQKGKLKKADYSDVDTSSLSESELQPITTKDQPVKVLKVIWMNRQKGVRPTRYRGVSEKTLLVVIVTVMM